MTSEPVEPSQRRAAPPGRPVRRRRRRDLIGVVLLVVVLVLALALALIYLNRRAAARQVLVGWLDQRGVPADVEVERIEMDGFVGRIRIGDPADPDVTVERVEVDYAVGLPWSARGLGVTPSRIRLVRPVVRATWAGGKLSFGSLDPLIKEFTGKPPRPDSRAPTIIVEQGWARLTTEYGLVQANADARLEDGKLVRLHAVLPAADLKSGDYRLLGAGGMVDLTTVADRVALRLDLSAREAAAAGTRGRGLRLTGDATLPYPDLKRRRGDGAVLAHARLTGDGAGSGDLEARGLALDLAFDGQATGWIDTLALRGRTEAKADIERATGPGLVLRSGRASVSNAATAWSADQGRWSMAGPVRTSAARMAFGDLAMDDVSLDMAAASLAGRSRAFEATGRTRAAARRLTFGDLHLEGVRGDADLDVMQQGALVVRAAGSADAASGGWPLLGPVKADDLPDLAAMKRALGRFSASAPAWRLETGSGGTRLTLSRPARVMPANGGVLIVQPAAQPLFAARLGERGGGALRLVATRGRGLPQATVNIPRWDLTAGGFRARLDGRAALDFDVARGLTVSTTGTLDSDNGRLTYRTTACAPFAVDRLELGENDATALSGRFCPTDGPVFQSRDGRWRVDGRAEDVAARLPSFALAFDQARGVVAATGSPVGLGLQAAIASAQVSDITDPRRFNPLTAAGTAGLADERWTAAFDISSGDAKVAVLSIQNDGKSGLGGLGVDTGLLTFDPAGLQPSRLTPLGADFVKSPVSGQARFEGRFDWRADAPDAGTSSGRLTIPVLDFVSPAGPVKGLRGTVDFTSLVPLTTAPDQTLHIDAIQTAASATDLDIGFSLDATALNVGGARIAVASGFVSVEPFSAPLDGSAVSGVVVLDRVQLGELLAGSGFGDKARLDAVVSGRVPFTWDARTGARVAAGELHAVQPGRLSIQREALSGLEAGGGGDGVPPNTVEDLAYQAMENLAFDTLSAEVNSLDGGRLAVLFHIKGRHDPPQHQELRLTIQELISRSFLNRPLPLPSDTGIDLTLDTTLNLNQLISDLLAVNRARAGQAAAAPVAQTPSPAP